MRAAEKRADDAWTQADEAGQRRDDIEAQWPHVRAVAEQAKQHRELNGWNNIARVLIDGGSR
jgi:hypothetical protein